MLIQRGNKRETERRAKKDERTHKKRDEDLYKKKKRDEDNLICLITICIGHVTTNR